MKNRENEKYLSLAKEFIKNENYEQAEKLLLSIKDESIEACLILIDLYFDNNRLDEELAMIIECADKGDRTCQGLLGNMYLEGERITKDYHKAFKYMLLSAKQNDYYSIMQVADFYKSGIGVKIDLCEAVKWYEKVIELKELEINSDTVFLAKLALENILQIYNENPVLFNDNEKLIYLTKLYEIYCERFYNYEFSRNSCDIIAYIDFVEREKEGNDCYDKNYNTLYMSYKAFLKYLDNNYKKIDSLKMIKELETIYNNLLGLFNIGYDFNNENVLLNIDELDKYSSEVKKLFLNNKTINYIDIKELTNYSFLIIIQVLDFLIKNKVIVRIDDTLKIC